MTRQFVTQGFNKGIHNKLDPELIPDDAAVDSLNWFTKHDGIELGRGQKRVGARGTKGSVVNQQFAYKSNGEKLHYKQIKVGDGYSVQYFNGKEWEDVITEMKHECSFANYSSLAGSFLLIGSRDGLYLIATANPTYYIDMYDPLVNFKGKIIIDKGRMILYDRETDTTGLYGSKIDPQDGDVFTTVQQVFGTGVEGKKEFNSTINKEDTEYMFGAVVIGIVGNTFSITNITNENNALITFSESHNYQEEDKIWIKDVEGMDEINNLRLDVKEVVDSFSVRVAINSTSFGEYTDSGTASKIEEFTDDYSGNLKSNLDGVGNINYVTGEVSVTFNEEPKENSILEIIYQKQNQNDGGITDFRFSANRVAGEGFILRQDIGGDPILSVLILDGSYFSMKERSVYRAFIPADDNPAGVTNDVFRRNTGIQHWASALVTSKGIIYMDMFDERNPRMTLLTRGAYGDVFNSKSFAEHFEFRNYDWSEAFMSIYDESVAITTKSKGSDFNDTLLIVNLFEDRVDRFNYRGNSLANSDGELYIGDSLSTQVNIAFSGFSNLGTEIDNFWLGKEEVMGTERLKKVRFLRMKGDISLDQELKVYIKYDEKEPELIGVIKGNSEFVDFKKTKTIGQSMVGEEMVGGNNDFLIEGVDTAPYFVEFKINQKKFNTRQILLVAGTGYVSVEKVIEEDILHYHNRMPKNRRRKPGFSFWDSNKVLDELLEVIDYYTSLEQ